MDEMRKRGLHIAYEGLCRSPEEFRGHVLDSCSGEVSEVASGDWLEYGQPWQLSAEDVAQIGDLEEAIRGVVRRARIVVRPGVMAKYERALGAAEDAGLQLFLRCVSL
jgi:hypothetical protein